MVAGGLLAMLLKDGFTRFIPSQHDAIQVRRSLSLSIYACSVEPWSTPGNRSQTAQVVQILRIRRNPPLQPVADPVCTPGQKAPGSDDPEY